MIHELEIVAGRMWSWGIVKALDVLDHGAGKKTYGLAVRNADQKE